MTSENSITPWIAGLKNGDERAAAALWESFFERLCTYARKKLGATPRRVRDEEDMALSAMNALFVGAREGRFQKLENRDDLWQILVMITARKASNVRRQQRVRHEAGESALIGGDNNAGIDWDDLLSDKSEDAFAASLSLECEELLARLDDKLREVALLKLAGHTNEEIGKIRNRSVKSVERYMQMIRLLWESPPEKVV